MSQQRPWLLFYGYITYEHSIIHGCLDISPSSFPMTTHSEEEPKLEPNIFFVNYMIILNHMTSLYISTNLSTRTFHIKSVFFCFPWNNRSSSNSEWSHNHYRRWRVFNNDFSTVITNFLFQNSRDVIPNSPVSIYIYICVCVCVCVCEL